ncbi:MAG: hypothetical protein KAI89_06020, partial [Emcibacter sp.]|nr:hypothetical protein [Emcibacter sp.]
EEKPKNNRRTRGRKRPSEDNAQQTSPNDGESKDSVAPEKQAEKKSTRRPYPPQARSRRKKSEDTKSDSKPETKSEPKAKPKSEPTVKTEAPKDTGPKKSGWWQRTFG